MAPQVARQLLIVLQDLIWFVAQVLAPVFIHIIGMELTAVNQFFEFI